MAPLIWEDSSGSPSHGRRRAGQVEGAARSPPALQLRPGRPRPAFSSLQDLKAEATPGCGQLSA